MKKLWLNKTTRKNTVTYAFVIAAYVVLQLLASGGGMKASLRGMLVPICAYVVMAISLNLTVGVLGELSLGHAGFMSVGAFTGVTAAIALQNVIPSAPLRLAVAMAVGAVFAGMKKTRAPFYVKGAVTGFTAAFSNTLFFMTLLVLFFGSSEKLAGPIAEKGVLLYIITSVGINAVVEMAVAALVTGAAGTALRKARLI